MTTKNGIVKKTPLLDFSNIRRSGLIAITLKEDDELIEVKATDGERDVMLVSHHGLCIRFHEKDVRATGRGSMGVIGMNLQGDDYLVGMQMDTQGDDLLLVSENGLGKRTPMDEFSPQHRGGKGLKCYKVTEKTGNLMGFKAVTSDNQIMLITNEGIVIRMSCAGISTLGRNTSGVKLMNFDTEKDIHVACITKVKGVKLEDEEEAPETTDNSAEE